MTAPAVFINCPFSADYQTHFRAIVFTVSRSGFRPRCALETDDATENRFDKICQIVGECAYGIHDISKTELDNDSGLPRFNMPLELGLYLAAKKFGGPRHRNKKCLIFDREPFRYQRFISDIAGQDIHAHGGQVPRVIEEVAKWLRHEARDPKVPGGRAIAGEFNRFSEVIPEICAVKRLHPDEITFQDFRAMAAEWIIAESRTEAPGRARKNS